MTTYLSQNTKRKRFHTFKSHYKDENVIVAIVSCNNQDISLFSKVHLNEAEWIGRAEFIQLWQIKRQQQKYFPLVPHIKIFIQLIYVEKNWELLMDSWKKDCFFFISPYCLYHSHKPENIFSLNFLNNVLWKSLILSQSHVALNVI